MTTDRTSEAPGLSAERIDEAMVGIITALYAVAITGGGR